MVGKLVIEYMGYLQPHTLSVGLLAGQLPGDYGSMLAAANALVAGVRQIVPSAVSFTGFHTLDPFGRRLIAGALEPPVQGTHGVQGEPWRSNTLTFNGKGQSNVDFGNNGNTRMMVHVFAAYPPTATEKGVPISLDSSLGALAAVLTLSVVFWADFYGVKASVKGLVTQQFNAHTQKKEGA